MPKVIINTHRSSMVPEFAGSMWVRLQYVLGLQKLGVQTFWIDRIYRDRNERHRRSLDYLANRFRKIATEFGFGDRYCIVLNDGEEYFGLSERQFLSVVGDADLTLDIGGHPLQPGSPMLRVPKRAHIDVDPGFTHMWAHSEDLGLPRHNLFFTVGQNVGSPEFAIPLRDIKWQRTLPPVVLDYWPEKIDEGCDSFSTVADWLTSQETDFQGEHYGGKRSEFIRMLDLPATSGQRIELALWIEAREYEDIGMLHRHGWEVVNPCFYAGDPHSYREFIQQSRGEFSVAKHGYVKSNSGWISDRTVSYLSSGKPALVQSTGFEGRIPTGMGLLTFRTFDEAVAGIKTINSDYLAHCRAARRLAETYFDSDVVLGRLLDAAGLT